MCGRLARGREHGLGWLASSLPYHTHPSLYPSPLMSSLGDTAPGRLSRLVLLSGLT